MCLTRILEQVSVQWTTYFQPALRRPLTSVLDCAAIGLRPAGLPETPRRNPTTFEDLIPLPKSADRCKSGPSGARKRKVGHAQVITSSPYKTALAESSSARPKSKIQKENVVERKRRTSQKPKVPAKLQIPTEEEDRTPCLYCEIPYCQSKVSWVSCRRCKRWACGDCVVSLEKKSFVCSECS